MSIADDLYRSYLDEMQALENFRVSYTSMHSQAKIEREDPEVRRLIDAMAFFTARTRTTAMRNLLATQRRLFQQFFSFLLSPMPSMATLSLVPTGKLVEPVTLPRDTEVMITPEGAAIGANFHLMREVRVLPVLLDDMEMLLLARAGQRIVLMFKTPYPRIDEVGTLPLFINHLDDYPASLTVLHNLKKYVKRAHVVWDEKVNDATSGADCEISWGMQEDDDTLPELRHPLQGVRTFFHYPQRDLYLNLKLPKAKRDWKSFSICLDLDAGWPKALKLNKDMFQPFCAPISNLRHAMAAPILCDGTESRAQIQPPETAAKLALHSVIGVYDITPKGMVALKPGIVSGGSGSWEIETTQEEEGEVPWLLLKFPEAFGDPRSISVDAFWLQPWFSKETGNKLKVALHTRSVPGVNLELRGELRPHAENRLREDFEGMLRILALRSKEVGFNLDDILLILDALGATKQGHFRLLPSYITNVEHQTLPQAREAGGGQRHYYKLRLKDAEPALWPMIDAGLAQVQKLLAVWTPDAEVALEARVEGADDREPLRYS